jgi:DNA-binding LacI/PurR family transcriptional regulator
MRASDPVIWATSTTGEDFQCVHVDDWQAARARIDALEALLREALVWCPRTPTHPTSAKRQAVGEGWCDLGDRIEAELAGNSALTEGPN